MWPDGTTDGAGVRSAVAIERFEKMSAPSAPCSLGGTEGGRFNKRAIVCKNCGFVLASCCCFISNMECGMAFFKALWSYVF